MKNLPHTIAVIAVLSFLFLTGLLSGCSTTVPVVVPPIQCGKYLDKDAMELCEIPNVFPEGVTYNDLILDAGKTRVFMKTCAARVATLQATIRACNQIK